MFTSRLLRALIALLALLSVPVHAAEGRPEVARHALAAPPAVEQSLASLAAYLAPAAYSPTDRAWSIFVWISDRVAYDVDAYLSGRFRNEQVSAEEVLKRRASVCDGFASLFFVLARSAGLDEIGRAHV